MTDYRVNLEIFAGPLDLLLYLVRKEEVDIYDIPIAGITDQYLRYIEMLKQLDVDVAGEFLVMAATLMEIKSAMLLPRAEPEAAGDEDTGDPRTELIRQLLEYKKFKDAANLLHAAAEQHKERFGRPASLIDRLTPEAEPELDMDQVSIWDLLEAFDTVCRSIGTNVYTGHIQDDTPIDLYQIEILHRLQTEGPLTFERIFESRSNRLVMVGLFLGLLELIRDKLIWAEQSENAPQIYVRALTDEPAEQAVQNAILAVDQTDEPENEIEPKDDTEPQDDLEDEPEDKSELEDEQAGESESQVRPPIPIAEIPPKRNPRVEHETLHPSATEGDVSAAEGDFLFDNP